MQKSPSTLLLERIRAAARRRGWNTAALAQEAGLERVELKPVLAGREPLSVDHLVVLVRALELTLDELGLDESALNEVSADTSSADQDAVESPGEEPGSNEPVTVAGDRPAPDAPDSWTVEPLGIHAEQVFRLGFGLGCDLFVVIDTTSLQDSGVPDSILERFPERLPIKLDAAFH
ncbi:MAG: hypothetical protein QGG40_12935, partial [Myxococcota bacterium]|nr:hypothetical protein [Myxococcota bacterium]